MRIIGLGYLVQVIRIIDTWSGHENNWPTRSRPSEELGC
jgi:hypothetical protein